MKFDEVLSFASSDARRDFPWQQWGIHEDRIATDTGWSDVFNELSNSANLSMCLALAEWILAGLRNDDRNSFVASFLQASWAVFSENWSLRYTEVRDADWEGPQQQMLAMTLTIVNDAIFCRDQMASVAYRTDWLMNYSLKLYSHSPIFNGWIGNVMDRLKALPTTEVISVEEWNQSRTIPHVSRNWFGLGASIAMPLAEIDLETEAWLAAAAPGNMFLSTVKVEVNESDSR